MRQRKTPEAVQSPNQTASKQDPRQGIQGHGNSPGRELSRAHAEEIERERAIPRTVAESLGVYTAEQADQLPDGADDYWKDALPAKLIPWSMNGTVEWQLAPDDRQKWEKYLFRKGAEVPLNCLRDTGSGPVLIVEGFWQSAMALVHAPAEFAVYGMAGVHGWAHADLSFTIGRPVVVVVDGDVRTNRAVYDAASALLESLSLIGADSVRFGMLPAQPQSQGLDDFLAKLPEQARPGVIVRLIDGAKGLPGRGPAKKKGNGSPFFGEGGLLVETLVTAINERSPAALTAEDKIALYVDGAFRIHRTAFLATVGELLGEENRPAHRAAAEEHMIDTLARTGRKLPDRLAEPFLNLQNGMLNLRTRELHPHSPGYLSSVQFPVAWDPDATCLAFDDWLAKAIPDQAQDLLEVASQMLDPTGTPHKALFLYGPSRSGKGTFLRLLEALVGEENRSSVSLHQLSENRFAASTVYGKKLNTAGDLSAAHVEDISTFKMMTGEDTILGDKKYGGQFSFVNRAMFAFSANAVPTVGETSRAYFERVKPYRFGNSFAGHEDPAIERAMLAELSGILVRLVEAWQARHQRGTWLPTVRGRP